MEEIIEMRGVDFVRMLCGGAAKLTAYKQEINDLNVFPIPDGDTGDNMLMTFGSGVENAMKAGEDLGEIAKASANGMLLGARGNSGVILSRIFAGISEVFSTCDRLTVGDFTRGMDEGVKRAYGAVSHPVEGTILTVLKDSVSYANGRVVEGSTINGYFDDLLDEMWRSLERTPELLPVLKEAGVVDSGGAGLYYVFDGMREALGGKDSDFGEINVENTAKKVDFSLFDENSILEYGYCTEFLLRLQTAKVDVVNFDVRVIEEYLNSVGDSVVCFKDGSIVKVHVHTKTPGDVLSHCQAYGEFLTLKIENMTLQNEEAVEKGNNAQSVLAKKRRKKTGIVAVAAGDGVKETLLSLGVDFVVDGGQSMNPSAGDLIAAFEEVNADRIFVFPNNSNVVLTAEQAKLLYDKSEIVVVKTKTVGEGYAAISMMDTNAATDEIITAAEESVSEVTTCLVSRANRNTLKNGVEVVAGDYIGFVGDEIYSDSPNLNEAAERLLDECDAGEHGLMFVFVGLGVDDITANELKDDLEKKYKSTEIIFVGGGQPVYEYMLVLF